MDTTRDQQPATSGAAAATGSTRRAVLHGAGVGAVLGLCAACGAGEAGAGATGSGSGAGGSGGGGSGGGVSGAAAGSVLVAAADVPVGGAVVLADAGVVVSQPVAGSYRGFSTRCTHSGCAVASVNDGQVECPCHGSRFSITDGAPTRGPAASPLATVAVKVAGRDVVRG